MKSDQATAAVVVCIIFPILVSLAFGLRFWSYRIKGHGAYADDYLLLSGSVIAVGHCGMMIYGATDAGFGWPAKDLVGPTPRIWLRILFSSQLLWAASITLIRIGLLMFYRRIFANKSFHIANNIMIGINIAWFIMDFFGTAFAWSWELTPSYTINYPVWLIANAALDMFLDLVTLCMPLFVIRTLHMSTKRKFVVSGIFSLGLFCVIASSVRLAYLVEISRYKQSDRKFATASFNTAIWSIIEPCTSSIAACLPTYGPLFKDGRGLSTLLRSVASKLSITSSSSHNAALLLPEDEPRKTYDNSMQSNSTEKLNKGAATK